MTYIRKTTDEFLVEQYTSEGWEMVTAEVTRRDAYQRVKEYRANQPEYPVRIRKTRVKKDTLSA